MPLLPSLRSNPQNRALTTTVYSPQQTRELELLPRFFEYAFQEKRAVEHTENRADGEVATPLERGSDDVAPADGDVRTPKSDKGSSCASSASSAEWRHGPLATSLKMFRPRPADQLAAVTASRKAIHRYRVLPALLAEEAASTASTPSLAEGKSASGQASNGRASFTPGLMAAAPSSVPRDPHIDAAIEALQPEEVIVPYLLKQHRMKRAAAALQVASSLADDAVVASVAKDEKRKQPRAGGGGNSNVEAVRRLFARYRGEAEQPDSEDTEEETEEQEGSAATAAQQPEVASSPCLIRERSEAGEGDGDLGAVVTVPPTLTDTLVDSRWVPYLARRQQRIRATAVLPPLPQPDAEDVERYLKSVQRRLSGPPPSLEEPAPHDGEEDDDQEDNHLSGGGGGGDGGLVVLTTPEEIARFVKALRWLLYDQQYQRRVLEHSAEVESPVPWLLDRTLDSAGGGVSYPCAPRCVLHEVAFTEDAKLHAAVEQADISFRERLRAHRAPPPCTSSPHSGEDGGRGGEALPVRARAPSDPAELAAIALHFKRQQERTLREAETEKESAFQASLRFWNSIPQRLHLVQREKQARLELLGRFASCTWPRPCRCLRWDAEILEDSAVSLSPTLYPCCVYASVVFGQYGYLADGLLEQRAAELEELRAVEELGFMMLYVFECIADDEAAAFQHLGVYHDYCMIVAAERGENAPPKYAQMSPFSVFERHVVSNGLAGHSTAAGWSSRPGVTGSDAAPPPPPFLVDGPSGEEGGHCLSHETPPAPNAAEDAPASNAAVDSAGSTQEVLSRERRGGGGGVPVFHGPRNSPFCGRFAFIELYTVQSAAFGGRDALIAEEAAEWLSLTRWFAFLKAAIALGKEEGESRKADLFRPEGEERRRIAGAFEEDTLRVASELQERQRRNDELARTLEEMSALVSTAESEHAKYIAECLEAFADLHRMEASAFRWAQLRDRQQREGTGADVANRWMMEQAIAFLAKQENSFRQKVFLAEVGERRLLTGCIRVAAEAFHEGERIALSEQREFEVMQLTLFHEAEQRLRLLLTYALEQFIFFGNEIPLSGCGSDETGPGAEPLWSSSGSSQASTLREAAAAQGRHRRRPLPTAMTVLDDVPCDPLVGAVAMQRIAAYSLYGFLPSHELFDLFSL